MSEAADDRVASGQTWRDFCRKLEAIGQTVLDAEVADRPIDRAEGYRYLSRLLRIALEMHLESADVDFPDFYAASHATAKIGADNPDNIYKNAAISGAQRYRLTGMRGSVPILSFGTKANRYAVDGTMASTGELDSADMKVGADGRFEVIVSRDKAEGNWLPLAEDSSMLIVRQTFLDRANETPATVEIEALDPPSARARAPDRSQAGAGLPAHAGLRGRHRQDLPALDRPVQGRAMQPAGHHRPGDVLQGRRRPHDLLPARLLAAGAR